MKKSLQKGHVVPATPVPKSAATEKPATDLYSLRVSIYTTAVFALIGASNAVNAHEGVKPAAAVAEHAQMSHVLKTVLAATDPLPAVTAKPVNRYWSTREVPPKTASATPKQANRTGLMSRTGRTK